MALLAGADEMLLRMPIRVIHLLQAHKESLGRAGMRWSVRACIIQWCRFQNRSSFSTDVYWVQWGTITIHFPLGAKSFNKSAETAWTHAQLLLCRKVGTDGNPLSLFRDCKRSCSGNIE